MNIYDLKKTYGDTIYKTGIYKISIKINPKLFYIGMASGNRRFNCHKGFYYRWKRHLHDLNKEKHPNRFLQRLFNKYGSNVLVFEIIEFCASDVCANREYKLMNELKPKLNLYKNKHTSVKKLSKETVKKIQKARVGYRHSQETKEKIGKAHTIVFSTNKINNIYKDIVENNYSLDKIESKYHHSSTTIIRNFKNKDIVKYEKIKTCIKTRKLERKEKAEKTKQDKIKKLEEKLKNREKEIKLIIKLYRAGSLIKAIREIVNLNEDLIGKLIRENMSKEELKVIKSKNAIRKC